MHCTRRSLLATGAGATALGTLAGCLDDPFGGGTQEGGYAAFFTLYDWAQAIAGDEMDFENPVPTGQMGHGFEPTGDLQRNIADTGVFVYFDSPEFAWAQEVADSLAADYEDVLLVDGMDGLDSQLLAMDRGDADREPDPDHTFDPETVSIGGLDLYDRRTGEEVAYWHGSHWHGELPETAVDDTAQVDTIFEDDEGRVLPLGADSPFTVDARYVDGSAEPIAIDARADHLAFEAREMGRGHMIIELVADGEVVWDTSQDTLTLDVVEELEERQGPQSPDPHVWVDPVIAQTVVATIADAIADLDPDNADTYEANAADYVERLEAVDIAFEDLAAEKSRDVAIFAGHDSFAYLEHRYDFELHTPTGVSADEDVSSGDIADLIEIVEDHDIDTILYDPFETTDGDEYPRMVEVLLEDTDATDAAPLTPVEGTTEEWNERGWGWVEQMEELNIDSLRQALDAN